jgi:ABC-type nickel/cobalt efflux system permease component RcnA
LVIDFDILVACSLLLGFLSLWKEKIRRTQSILRQSLSHTVQEARREKERANFEMARQECKNVCWRQELKKSHHANHKINTFKYQNRRVVSTVVHFLFGRGSPPCSLTPLN